MQGAGHLLRLQVLVCNNGRWGGQLHWRVEFWHVEIVCCGWCGGTSTLGSANVGMHVELGGCVRDLELRNQRRQRSSGFGKGMHGDIEFWGGGCVNLGHVKLWHEEGWHVRYLDVQNPYDDRIMHHLDILGVMRRGTMACRQQWRAINNAHPCPHPHPLAGLALALAPFSTLAFVALAPCRSRRQ